MQTVYLDHNATTPVDQRVIEAMMPFFTTHYGNASSKMHAFGWAAEEAVEMAREAVATLLKCEPQEVTFTSGATESLNLAIKGAVAAAGRPGHVVTVSTEHRAVLDTCKSLEKTGTRVTYLPVGSDGVVQPQDVEAAIDDETLLVAVMWGNNETGTIQPVGHLADIARARRVPFLTDATQAVGKIQVDAGVVDLLACSAHKFYGPKGVGALCIRRRGPRARLRPILDGGGQEQGMRGGTLNVPGIVGMGAAAQIAAKEMDADADRLGAIRSEFESRLLEIDGTRVNSADAPRLPQTTSVTFESAPSEKVFAKARTLAMSIGSACSSKSAAPSHVLKAMGLSDEQARSTIRISMGRWTTSEEMNFAAETLGRAVRDVRSELARSTVAT